MTTNLAQSPFSESMLNRSEGQAPTESVMDSIHTIKVYNAPPGKLAEADKAGLILRKTDQGYVPFTEKVKVNIISVRRVYQGAYYLLDSQGERIKKDDQSVKGFAHTNEFQRFQRNTDNVVFRDNETESAISLPLSELKNILKQPTINGVKNKFHKTGKTFEDEPYDASYINPSFVMYGVFKEGEFKGEYFRMFISQSAFGSKFNAQFKTFEDIPGSLSEGLKVASELFKKYTEDNNITAYFSDSFTVADLQVEENNGFYFPRFMNVSLVSEPNDEDYEFIRNIQDEYYKEKFSNIKSNTLANPTPVNAIAEPKENVQEKPKPTVTKTKVPVNDEITINDIPF